MTTAIRQATDEVLCFCDQVKADDFRRAIRARPEATFDELCRITRVGLKCTSCLLNAETLYADPGLAPAPAAEGARPRARAWRPSRQALYAAVDRLSPRVPFVRTSIVPVIAGRGARTIVALSNAVAPDIGPRPPPFRLHAEVHAADGALLGRIEAAVPPGGRFELDTGRWLGGDGGDFVTGSCRVTFRALEHGYFGTIRPHFAVVTPVAACAVHGAHRGKREAFHASVLANDAERQFVSVVNCTARQSTASVSWRAGGGGECSAALPALGAALLAVEHGHDRRPTPITVAAASGVESRFHYMVSDGAPPRVSLDHI